MLHRRDNCGRMEFYDVCSFGVWKNDCIGTWIIGEHVGHIFMSMNHTTQYVIRDMMNIDHDC